MTLSHGAQVSIPALPLASCATLAIIQLYLVFSWVERTCLWSCCVLTAEVLRGQAKNHFHHSQR